MESKLSIELGNKLQIAPERVAREEYEVLLLRELFESEFGEALVFRGGTALRLAYGSPRFSEDLDFTLRCEVDKTKLIAFLTMIGKQYPGVRSVEALEKFYTVFGMATIEESYLVRPFRIKIEISKREEEWEKGKDYADMLIKSDVIPVTVLAQVATLEKIKTEKEGAMRDRKVARDVFDYWYIHQLLKTPIAPDLSGYDKRAAKDELHKLLGKSSWRVVDSWLE